MDFNEIFTSGSYQKDMKILKILASNISEFQFFKKKNWQIGVGCALADIWNFSFKQPLVLKKPLGIFFDSRNSKMTSKLT